MPKILYCLMGPTASGKTALACELLNHLSMEIISVDSAMIYRGMNIGTAKPDVSLLKQAPHHLIDILDPPETYSAARFCEEVINISEAIYNRGRLPLLVGGTMMYFHALQHGLVPLPTANNALRQMLLKEAACFGWEHLYQRLLQVDPVTAVRLHPHDTQRIQRALEVYILTKKPLSTWISTGNAPSDYRFINMVLVPQDRAWLHQRIRVRFEHMLKAGFIDEVCSLLQTWSLTKTHPSMRSVGYRQALAYLAGEYTQEEFYEKGLAATRQLAKRQLTWLRHWQDSLILVAEEEANVEKVVAIIKQILDNPTRTIAGEGDVSSAEKNSSMYRKKL